MAVLRRAGKVAAGAVPTAVVAGLGLPALGSLLFLAVLVLGVICWVIGSRDRTERVSRVLLAWRGNPGCLSPGGEAPSPVVPRPRRGGFQVSGDPTEWIDFYDALLPAYRKRCVSCSICCLVGQHVRSVGRELPSSAHDFNLANS